MISTHVTTTGAAGMAPIPAAVVRASSRGGAVQLAPTAPQHGTGLLSEAWGFVQGLARGETNGAALAVGLAGIVATRP